jgi:hypothetical protein
MKTEELKYWGTEDNFLNHMHCDDGLEPIFTLEYVKQVRNKTIDEAIDIVTDYQDANPLVIERLKALKVNP